MKTLHEIKQEKENRVSELIRESSMFFAFSNEQFKENKTPLMEGEKYVNLGMGAYIPKSKVDMYLNGMEKINKWFKVAIKENDLKRANISYELANHEAYYTYEIESTKNSLGDDYTMDEIRSVFNEEIKKQPAEY